MILFLGPIWIAFLVGVVLGWAWKPKWVNLGGGKLEYSESKTFDLSAPPSPSPLISSLVKSFNLAPCLNSLKEQPPSCRGAWVVDSGVDKELSSVPLPIHNSDCSTTPPLGSEKSLLTEDDLQHLNQLAEMKDGGPSWIPIMDRSTPNMSCQVWRRDPETGPPQYRTRTVYEDATPETLRDFFWDDEFRLQWDDMLVHAVTIEECPTTGTMVVHWIRKFPFFCSDRDYTIGRRIWAAGRSYYCATKGVPCPSVPRRDKPRRVDLYYSSWCIQAVESRKGDGQMSACEVLLFHHEDMGIPWEIAKFGVQQGMWRTVKKIEAGLRAYQKERAAGVSISQSGFMAQVNTKISSEYLRSLGSYDDSSETEMVASFDKPRGANIPKLLFFGGIVVLACSLDRGLLTKAFIFSVARRFANIGRRPPAL
ncbi:hypothetical protein L1049_019945 [Liquidambar formosana]|uniref:START domain-containing protein n=1 Tax=Liquidambar formosana TaxID=63359 RepID=A0AAP0S6G2_LIQFO